MPLPAVTNRLTNVSLPVDPLSPDPLAVVNVTTLDSPNARATGEPRACGARLAVTCLGPHADRHAAPTPAPAPARLPIPFPQTEFQVALPLAFFVSPISATPGRLDVELNLEEMR